MSEDEKKRAYFKACGVELRKLTQRLFKANKWTEYSFEDIVAEVSRHYVELAFWKELETLKTRNVHTPDAAYCLGNEKETGKTDDSSIKSEIQAWIAR